MAGSRNIFISHKGVDDEQVQNLKARLNAQGYDVRNFSVDSTNHKDGRRPSDAVIARLLRMRVSWSSTLICLIGPDTYKSKYVNDEIRYAHEQGKRIVGIYTYGSANNVEIPEAFKKYGGAPLGWNSLDKLGDAIEGKNIPAENPDGSARNAIYQVTRVKC
jgi:hypothetical protein